MRCEYIKPVYQTFESDTPDRRTCLHCSLVDNTSWS